MRTTSILTLLTAAAFTLSTHAADPKETVAGAIKALKDKGSYSWSTASESRFGDNEIPASTTKGKTDKDGLMLLSSQGQNGEVHVAKKGEKAVIKSDAGWQTREERQAAGGGGGGRGGFGGMMMLNALAPAADAEELLKGVKELKAGDGGLFSGDLTEAAAKTRATFGGRGGRGGGAGGFTPPEPKDAKASVKFWVKDGLLSKYEIKSSSKMTFQDQENEIARTATTEISGAGSTTVEVPDEAKKKL